MQPAYISYKGISRMQAARAWTRLFSLPLSPTLYLSLSLSLLACDEIFIVPRPGLRDTRAHAKPYRSAVPRIFHAEAGASNKSPQKREKVVGPRAGASQTTGRRDEARGLIDEIGPFVSPAPERNRRSYDGRSCKGRKEDAMEIE